MNQEKTDWHLKTKEGYCDCVKPVCLRFLSCPTCSTIALQCDKTGIVFPDPRATVPVECDTFTCPQCHKHPIDDFGGMLLDDILKLGFKKEECV